MNEYKHICISSLQHPHLEERLNQLAREGWRVMNSIPPIQHPTMKSYNWEFLLERTVERSRIMKAIVTKVYPQERVIDNFTTGIRSIKSFEFYAESDGVYQRDLQQGETIHIFAP